LFLSLAKQKIGYKNDLFLNFYYFADSFFLPKTNAMKKDLIPVFFLFLLLSLASCRKDITDDNRDFIGTWEGDYTTLVINADGSGSYQYDDGTLSKNIGGRVVFKGSLIKFSFLAFSKKYTIEQRPITDANDRKKMVLSGETFQKF
jgi:hypothetical protein